MFFLSKVVTQQSNLKKAGIPYEYEIILFVFFILRFISKNILQIKEFFTKEPIFGFSENTSIVAGITTLLFAVLLISAAFGRIIRSCEADCKNPVVLLTAFFLACPSALPFLFNTGTANGTQLLYPFALFTASSYIAVRPFLRWLVPGVCAFYFIPATFSSDIFYISLRKGAVLYVPLLILLLYLETIKKSLETGNPKEKPDKQSKILLAVTAIVSVCSCVYSYWHGFSWGVTFGMLSQKIDLYFFLGLLLSSPFLFIFGAVLIRSVKNKFPMNVTVVFWRFHAALFLLFWNNYYTLWIPFLILSSALFIFYAIKVKNSSMISSVQSVGKYLSERRYITYILLIAMASLSNVSSNYFSSAVRAIFNALPY